MAAAPASVREQDGSGSPLRNREVAFKTERLNADDALEDESASARH
jgi:hypothetical protein